MFLKVKFVTVVGLNLKKECARGKGGVAVEVERTMPGTCSWVSGCPTRMWSVGWRIGGVGAVPKWQPQNLMCIGYGLRKRWMARSIGMLAERPTCWVGWEVRMTCCVPLIIFVEVIV